MAPVELPEELKRGLRAVLEGAVGVLVSLAICSAVYSVLSSSSSSSSSESSRSMPMISIDPFPLCLSSAASSRAKWASFGFSAPAGFFCFLEGGMRGGNFAPLLAREKARTPQNFPAEVYANMA